MGWPPHGAGNSRARPLPQAIRLMHHEPWKRSTAETVRLHSLNSHTLQLIHVGRLMDTPLARPLPRADAKSVDVVILGAGVIGAAIARELTRAGLSVTIVEASDPGCGTSGRCDGNILVQTKLHEPELVLTRRAIGAYREWATELENPIHLHESGSLVFFTDEEQAKAGHARATLLTRLGVAAELLDEEGVRALEPAIDGPQLGGLDCAEDSSVYPPYVVYALLADAIANGARLMTTTTAQKVITSGDRVRAVQTNRGTISTRWVINAMGIWSASLEVDSATAIPVQPRQGVLLVTEERPGLFKRAVTEGSYMTLRSSGSLSDPRPDPVFVAEPTFRGNVLIGSSRRFVGYTTEVDTHLALAILERARRYVSVLDDVKIIRSFAGLRPWTPDHYPIVGETDVEGYLLATGHEGEGIALAPVTAEMILTLVTGESIPSPLGSAFELFSPARHGTGTKVLQP